MKTHVYTAILEQEGNGDVSLCPELDIASQGRNVEEAIANLREAVELFLETADSEEINTRIRDNTFHPPQVEVTNISNNGLWIYVKDKEYFLAYTEYPWFANATVAQIFDVRFYHNKHLHWPALDVDIELESLENPESYPLSYR